jgi:hypothetical protein
LSRPRERSRPAPEGCRIIKIALWLVLLLLTPACSFASDRNAEQTSSTRNCQAPFASAEQSGLIDVPVTLSGAESVFVSDYFSFIGTDERGHVAFAIDNDRARHGKRFVADAHVVLHDEHEGWIDIRGGGSYKNKGEELLSIPDSPYFQFTGEVKNGITLRSPQNLLELTVDPMIERVCRTGSESIYSMGSTSATLKWKDRSIRGRVIYEYIFMKNLSPWCSFVSGLFYNDFQGLYLMTIDGGDFYLHTSRNEAWSKTVERELGFHVSDEQNESLEDLKIEAPERTLAFGFYRWPHAWRVSWRSGKGQGSLSIKVMDRKVITNWLIGGFPMAIVRGEMSYGGKTRPVYGLAELIR